MTEEATAAQPTRHARRPAVPVLGGRMQPTTVTGILRSRALRMEFQPVVDLRTGDVVGHEALMRGPVGALGSPGALLEAAEREGVLEDLDRLGRFSALFATAGESQSSGRHLFVNAECCATPVRFGHELAVLDGMAPGVQVVLSVTERASRRCPEVLAETAAAARSAGWLVALDRVGANGWEASRALLAAVRPDFVALEPALVQGRSPATVSTALEEVRSYVDETAASVVADGIESNRHLRTARSLGATWGRGWLLGLPGPRFDTQPRRSIAALP